MNEHGRIVLRREDRLVLAAEIFSPRDVTAVFRQNSKCLVVGDARKRLFHLLERIEIALEDFELRTT